MKRGNRLRRAALLLALLVLAATVTGVAESAANTVIPKPLTGSLERHGLQMNVHSSGEVVIAAIHTRESDVMSLCRSDGWISQPPQMGSWAARFSACPCDGMCGSGWRLSWGW